MTERDDWEDDYDNDYPADECDHDDYEVDILAGRAQCNRCPHSWYQTSADIEREIDRIREYDRWMHEEQMREHWWGRAWLTIKGWLTRLAPPAVRDPSEGEG